MTARTLLYHQYQNQSQSQFQLKHTTNQPNALIPQIDYPLCVCSTWANLIQPIKVWNEWWKFELLFMLLLNKYFFLQKQQSIYFRYLQSLHVYKVLQHWRLPTIFNWNLIWILLKERNYVWLCSTDVNASSIKFMFIEISWLNF